MATLTEMVAAVVVHSSAAAFSHFGVTVETPRVERAPAAERVVARTPRRAPEKACAPAASDCPEGRRARPQRA